MFVFFACNKSNNDNLLMIDNSSRENAIKNIVYSTKSNVESIKFVVRHSNPPNGNCECPGCKCPGCPCPLGICFCGGIQKAPNGGLTKEEKAEDFGTAFAEVRDGKLHLIFNQATSLPDGTIPIDENYVLNSDELNLLGIPKGCYIHEGIYIVDFSKNPFGEVYLDLSWL